MKLQRLPGKRRGFVQVLSLWAADDHILSVTSQRLRERYRRFYYRDIQAIVVTRAPRYVFSTRSAVLGALLAIGCIFPMMRAASGWLLAACVAAWAIVSWKFSCVCRLHTAVSAETLGSVYRIWSARKLIEKLEPRIQGAQAGLPPPEPGAEPGPSGVVPVLPSTAEAPPPAAPSLPSILAAPPPLPPRTEGAAVRRTTASLLLLFLVLADAATTAYDSRLAALGVNRMVAVLLLLAQVATLMWMIVQNRAGRLARSILYWAIAFLVFVAGAMYAQTLANTWQQARSGKQPSALSQNTPASLQHGTDEAFRKFYTGGCVLFALAGAFLMFRPAAGDER